MIDSWSSLQALPIPVGIGTFRILVPKTFESTRLLSPHTERILTNVGELQMRLLEARDGKAPAVTFENISTPMHVDGDLSFFSRIGLDRSDSQSVGLADDTGEAGRLIFKKGDGDILFCTVCFLEFPFLPAIVVRRRELKEIIASEPDLSSANWDDLLRTMRSNESTHGFLIER
jgi:hypothetical protein